MRTPDRFGRLTLLTLVAFVLSCVTINVYFPAAEVEAAADRIVEDVYSGGAVKGESTSWLLPLHAIFGARAAMAQEVDINISSPAIRALRSSLEARHPKLVPYYESGAIGITKTGRLATRELGSLDLKQKAELKKLLDADNADRDALYREIVKANDLDEGNLKEVDRIFAESWREKARPGWWIQKDDGTWVQKKA